MYSGGKHELMTSVLPKCFRILLAISLIYVQVSGLRNNNVILNIDTQFNKGGQGTNDIVKSEDRRKIRLYKELASN